MWGHYCAPNNTGAVLGKRNGREARIGQKGAVVPEDPDEAYAFFLGEAFGRVEAHVAESLDNDPLAFEAALQTATSHVVRVAEELAEDVLDATTGSLLASRNTALGHRADGIENDRHRRLHLPRRYADPILVAFDVGDAALRSDCARASLSGASPPWVLEDHQIRLCVRTGTGSAALRRLIRLSAFSRAQHRP